MDMTEVAQHGGMGIKRIALVAALLLTGAAAAHADVEHYTNMFRQPRGDDALNVDGAYCDQRLGPNRSGVPVSAAYKRCMRSRGWRYDYTRVEKTWIDPDTGLRCHDI